MSRMIDRSPDFLKGLNNEDLKFFDGILNLSNVFNIFSDGYPKILFIS